ncbi:hypothetical protein BST81_22570 [Leptolyngbya sp. 'hensonii']|uniref:rhodanese-like domain-containing protein n=1 Tax=Leptolyngbya sp. 'hensonii' TaxID=1922337 RepID=UPI00094FADC6|nr:rhodanese-like domain-containing protein [Leptolyngbya sp. 'hensonii']OLP16189.1 hypothetical protein BST81_22570 [Leptolyngbya sp. 'hensonii']
MFPKLSRQVWRRLYPGLVVVGLAALGTGGLAIAAYSNQMDIPTYIASLSTPQVTVADLQQGKLKPVVLVDVRSPEEHDEDRIGNSELVPLSDLEMGFGVIQIKAIAKAAQKGGADPTLVLYCTAGARSVKAYKLLQATGLKFVVLKGGIQEWRRQLPASQDAAILSPITLAP